MFWFLGCLLSPSEYADLEAQAQDADGDGQGAVAYGGLDCDDSAPETYAGAPEQCDGLDNDCDQDIDEDIEGLAIFYPDADSDGHGTEDGAVAACEAPEGFVGQAGDCDDGNPAVRPNEPEVCGNGVDDDCDGQATPSCWSSDLGLSDGENLAGSWALVEAISYSQQEQVLWVQAEAETYVRLSTEGVEQVEVLLPGARGEFGLSADNGLLVPVPDGACRLDGTETLAIAEECLLLIQSGTPLMVGRTGCAFEGGLLCAAETESDPTELSSDAAAAGLGPWSGVARHLAIAEGAAVSIYSETQLRGETTPTATLTLPATPTALCLLDQAVVWADADGTHLTSAAGDTVLISESTGQLQCMEAGSEYVMILPSSNDQVEVVNLSGFGESAWGLPLVVRLPSSDDLLANKATLAAADGQAYLFIAHGTELRRLALGLGL